MRDIKEKIVRELKKIYDPEIPVNIYDLGLIYDISCNKAKKGYECKIVMTLTSAFCPAAESIVKLVENIKNSIEELEDLKVELVFDPPWDRSKMSDEAKLQLGIL